MIFGNERVWSCCPICDAWCHVGLSGTLEKRKSNFVFKTSIAILCKSLIYFSWILKKSKPLKPRLQQYLVQYPKDNVGILTLLNDAPFSCTSPFSVTRFESLHICPTLVPRSWILTFATSPSRWHVTLKRSFLCSAARLLRVLTLILQCALAIFRGSSVNYEDKSPPDDPYSFLFS